MQWLPTGLAFVFAGLALWFSLQCLGYWQRVAREQTRLRNAFARIEGIDAAVETLAAQHRTLRGKFYQDRAKGFPPDLDLERHTPRATSTVACENYARAQVEGPLSEAAKCACAECERKRIERDELRQKLPKGPPAARVRAIEAAK